MTIQEVKSSIARPDLKKQKSNTYYSDTIAMKIMQDVVAEPEIYTFYQPMVMLMASAEVYKSFKQ